MLQNATNPKIFGIFHKFENRFLCKMRGMRRTKKAPSSHLVILSESNECENLSASLPQVVLSPAAPSNLFVGATIGRPAGVQCTPLHSYKQYSATKTSVGTQRRFLSYFCFFNFSKNPLRLGRPSSASPSANLRSSSFCSLVSLVGVSMMTVTYWSPRVL